MSKELPLKVRIDIRDIWDAPKSSVNEAVSALNKILGHMITPHVEWPALWAGLKDKFPDNAVFVPTIVRYTIAWYERMSGRADNEAYREWADELLNALQGAGGKAVSLHIEVGEPGVARPSTKLSAKFATFHLYVPRTEPVSQNNVDIGFDHDFVNLFNADAKPEDEWTNVSKETVTRAAARTTTTAPAAAAGPEFNEEARRLPVLDALARPTELFCASGPYILIVEERGATIVVQCSHEPSLELLSSYLKKYAKGNPSDSLKRSILKADLVESEAFFGVFDTLIIERTMARDNYGPAINPTFILAFIEGVLGYKLTNTTGSCRTYTSTTLFK